MARRTKAEAESTREAILDAAERVFVERGVARTSLEEIARTAGLTRGAIYWHFKNKVDLFNAMIDRVRLPLEGLIEELDSRGDQDPIAVLRRSIGLLLQHLADNDQYRRVYTIYYHRFEQVGEFAASNEHNRNMIRGAHESLCNLFERAEQRGLLRGATQPMLAAMTIRLYLIGLYSDWLRDPDRYDIEMWGMDTLDALLHGLLKEQPA